MEEGVEFYKYQNLGNDFVIIDRISQKVSVDVRKVCDRHFGVGADGVLYLDEGYTMRIFNPDGSEAEMCGNGALCMAKFLYEKGYVDGKEISLQTKGGEVRLYLELRRNKVGRVRERMPEPKIEGIKKLDIDGKSIEAFLLSLGNPHAVIFEDLSAKAEKIEEIFNGNMNIEFAEIISPSRINLKVYERGAGFTLACGTGACASVFAGYRYKGIADKVEVSLPGGSLEVEIIDNRVYMSSEPAEVFKGVIEDDC